MLKVNLRFLYNKRKNVPLLRGRIYLLIPLMYPIFAYFLFQHELDYLTKLTFSINIIGFLLGSIACFIYHNTPIEIKDREIYQRIDYACIFVQSFTNFLPALVHYVETDFHIIMLLLHFLLNFTGAISSLLFNFIETSRGVRVFVYWVFGSFNCFILYKSLKKGDHLVPILYISCYSIVSIGSIIYSLKRPNLIPGIFEHHELSHLLYVIGSVLAFMVNVIATDALNIKYYHLT